MRRSIKTSFCAVLLLFVCLVSQAQTWRDAVLQKTKAAQTIDAIKTNLAQKTENRPAKTINAQHQKQMRESFAYAVKQAYPSAKIQNILLERYQTLNKALHSIPLLRHYALTVQHPADLYTATPEEIQILKDILLSFNTLKNPCPFTPYQTVEFASGAVVVSFQPEKDNNALHFAFKPQENTLKIAVGDFPLSRQEFGPLPNKQNED